MDIFGYIDRTSIKTIGIYAIALSAFLTILVGGVYLVISSIDWSAWVRWLVSILIILFWCVCGVLYGYFSCRIFIKNDMLLKRNYYLINSLF